MLKFTWLSIILILSSLCFAQTNTVISAAPPKSPVKNTGKDSYLHYKLTIISGNSQKINAKSKSQPLEVRLTDIDGNPIRDQVIKFELLSSFSKSENVQLTTESMKTTPLGVASTSLITGKEIEKYIINAQWRDQRVTFTVSTQEPNWLIFLIIGLFGGLAIFIYGMSISSESLQKAAGPRLKSIMKTLTSNAIIGVLIGLIITVMTQSSSATSVMLVSFANASLVTLRQTLSVLLGAGIGTTLTVQLIAFKFSEYSLVFVVIGLLMRMISKNKITRSIGEIIIGFGFIFFGMKVMSESLVPLKTNPAFQNILLEFSPRKVLSLIVATVFTGIIQSSGATIALLISFSDQGLMTLDAVIPMMLGANIGTCVTALLGAVGTSAEAKQVAWAQIIQKIIGVLILLPLITPFKDLTIAFGGDTIARQIANSHTLFNVLLALILLPFNRFFERMMRLIIKSDSDKTFSTKYIKAEYLETPAHALDASDKEIAREAEIVQDMMKNTFNLFDPEDYTIAEIMEMMDDKVDIIHVNTVQYLSHIPKEKLTPEQSEFQISLIYITDHLENIGDILIKNIMPLAEKVKNNDLHFSDEGWKDIKDLYAAVYENLSYIVLSLNSKDYELVHKVIRRKVTIKNMITKLKMKHIERLQKGSQLTMETTGVHLDLISQFRRINSHLCGIGHAIVDKADALIQDNDVEDEHKRISVTQAPAK